MAIALEFIDFIVPIETIKQKYPGGWEKCLKDHSYDIGRRVWYDEHLFRDGAMSPMDIESLVNHWGALGFNTHETNSNGEPIEWLDICVAEGLFGGATLACKWISFETETGSAHLTGTVPGKIKSRSSFEVTDQIPAWIFE